MFPRKRDSGAQMGAMKIVSLIRCLGQGKFLRTIFLIVRHVGWIGHVR